MNEEEKKKATLSSASMPVTNPPEEKEKATLTSGTKNKGSGIGYVAGNLGLGLYGILEGSYNFIKGGAYSLFGGEQGNRYASYLFQNRESAKLTEELNKSYNPGKGMKFAGEVGQGIGQSSVFYMNALGGHLGTIIFFTGAAGNSISEAVARTGKLGWKEYGYGILSGATEAALEKISGAAGAGLGTAGKTVTGTLEKTLGKVGKDTAKQAVRNGVAKSVISGAAGEFFEEFLGEYADVLWQRSMQIDPNASTTFGDAVYAGLVGAASGGLMEGAQTAVRATFSHTQGSKIIAEGKADALVSTVKTMQEQVKSKDWSKYYKSEEKDDIRGYINNLVAAYQAYENLPADKKTGDYAKVYLGEMQSNLAILEAVIGRSNIEADIAANAEKYVRYANQIRGKEFTAEDIKSNKDGILTQLALARWAFQFNDVETVGQHKRRWVAQQIEQQKRRGIDISEGTNAAEGGSQSILNRAGVTDSGIEWSENDDGGALTRIYHLGKDRMVVATEYGDGEWVMAAGTGDTLLADDGENVATRVKTAELDKVVTEIRDNYDAIVEKATAEREKKAEAPEENSGSEKELRQKAPKTGKPIAGADNVMYATEGDLKDARLDPGKLVKSKLSIKQKATITLLSKYLEAGGYRVLLFEGNGRGANGAYRGNTIYLDINAKILRVAAHELVHSFKAKSPDMYTRIRDFVVEKEFDNDQAKLDQAIEDITKLYAENGEELKPEVAEEEIIAKSCEKVFGSVEALRSMFDTDKELFHSANAFLGTMQAFFRSIIDSYGATNEYAAAMEKSAEDLEELRARFAEAMQASLKADQKPRNAGESDVFKSINRDDALGEVYRNGDGDMTVAENVDEDKVFYSFETYDNGGRKKLAQVLKDHGYSKAEVKAAMEPIEHMTEVLRRLADRFEVSYGALKNNLYATVATDITGTRQILSTLVSNGEYPVNLDLQLICKKRVAYMELMARLLEDGVFGQVKYDGDAIAMINEILSMNGYETACLGCFVESRRQMLQKWAETIIQEWNDEVKKRNPDATYFPFAVDSGKTISEEEMVRVESELSQLEKNDLGNVKLGADKVKDKMGELLDKAPSLGHLLTADTILTPDGLKALQATAGGKTLVSLVKQRYGTASPKLVQEFNPYNSELADLTFENAKKITGNSVTGAGEYMKKAKEVLGKKPAKRKSETDAQYKERVSKWEREVNEWAVQQYLFDIGGARIQSFSDFMIENVFDYFQIMGDLAAKGFPIHGYTKEIVCARLFGQTGAKWNGSLIATLSKDKNTPAGLISEEEYESWKKNGKIPEGLECIKVTGRDGKTWYIGFDDFARNKATKGSAKQTFIQSIGMKDIMSLILDPRYSKSVGNITIGVSDEQIIAMLRSPYFRMVIPYHLSGMGKDFAIRTGVDAYTDYTAYQNTRIGQLYDIKGNPVDSLGLSANDLKKQIESFNFNARLRDVGDARAVADEYIAWCRQRHEIRDGKKLLGYSEYLPKFSGSEDGKYYDFTQEENYYKLLEDFNVYDAVDELKGIRTPAPQEAVKMIFPGDKGRNLTKKELDAYRTRLKKVGIFTDADIDKIIERANWTTEQIIEHELEGRAAYKANADKMWEPTVNLIETALMTKKRLDQFKTVDEFEEMASSKSDNVKQQMLTIRPVNGTYRVEDTDIRYSYSEDLSGDSDESLIDRYDKVAANAEGKNSWVYGSILRDIVSEYAKRRGFTKKLFHGTTQFGFTKVDMSYSDDGISFWTTDNEDTASTYSGETGTRSIKDKKLNLEEMSFNQLATITDQYGTEHSDSPFGLYFDCIECGYREAPSDYYRRAFELGQEDLAMLLEEAFVDDLIGDEDRERLGDIVDYTPDRLDIEDFEWAYRLIKNLETDGDRESWVLETAQEKLKSIIGINYGDGEGYVITEDGTIINKDQLIEELKKLELDGELPLPGNYELLGNVSDFLEIDAHDRNWNDIYTPDIMKGSEQEGLPIEGKTRVNTRGIAEFAYQHGYPGVVIRNVYDHGGKGYSIAFGDVYIFFDGKRLKSADPVTYDNDGNVIPLEKRFEEQKDDLRYSFNELDKEYDEAVKSGNKYRQELLVRDAARKAGYDTPMLFHGTPRFGFTTFDPLLYSPQSPYIYTSSKSNVSANYAGDNHYAARRDIGRKYRTGDSLSDIIANAETIWGKKYHEATEAERKAKYDQVIKEGAKAADKIDELYVDIDYPNESVMNAAAWIGNLMFSARDYDNYFEAESDEERNVIRENWASDIRNFAESVPELKEWYEEHRKDLTPEQRKYVAYLLSYDVGDAAIDLEYSLQRAISDGRILAGEDGSLANADELKGSMDEIHNIGSYQLYGNLGENPFEFDANGGQFWALKVPEMGEGYHGTDAVCKWAKENGYTSVIMRNIYDYGEKADNYVFFEPSQLKSADNITYDDDGNVIPLSERFNPENDDIRYSFGEEKRGRGETQELLYTAAEQDEARDYVSNFDAYDPDTRISVLEFLRSAKGTKADKKILRTISNIIVASNDLDVRFADTEEKGVYIRGESGQQLILLDSKLESADAIRKTLSAEMIHMAEQNAEGYDKFAKIVLAMTPPEEKEKIEKKYRDYWESVGREISDEALLHECVSELGADLIQDYDLVSRWANRDRSFVTRLLSAARSLARSLFGKDKDAYRQAAQMTAMLADALTGRAASNEGPVIRYQLGDKKTKPVSEREQLQDQARAIHYFTMPRSRQLINEWVDTLIKPYFTEGSGSPYVPTIVPRDLSLKKLNIPTGTALRVRGLDGIVKALYVDFYTAETTREAKKAAEFIADSILNKTYLGDTDISVNDAVKSKDTALAIGMRSALKDKIYEALTGGEAESAVDSIRVRYENLMKGVEAEAKRRESELERQIGEAKGVMKATLQAIEQINRARKQYKDGYYRYQGTLAAPEIKLLTDAVIAAKSRGGYLIPESTRKALLAFNDVFRIEQLRADLNEEYEVLGMNVETIKDLDYTVNQMVKDYDIKDEADMAKPLTAAEIETFADVARATAQLYRTYNKYWDEKRKTWIDADETAKRGIDIVEATQKLREADPKIVKKMREVMDKYGIEALDPLAVSRLLDGYDDDGVMTEIITDVMNAENAKTLRIQKYMREVDEFIKATKGFEKHLTSEEDMIEYRGQKLTRDEFIQLYMTTFRKQALLHLGLGRMEFGSVGSKYGLRIIAPYIQAAEAATGSTEKVEAPTIEELQNESEKVVREIRALGEKVLTPEDRKYIELMEKFYNTVSTNDKRETDYKYFGMTNVNDDPGDKYVPIVTSSSSRASSITDERTAMLDFATLSGQSFNKNTVRGAKNPLSITGAYGLMQKHANGLAAYVELYAAMQKLDRIWSTDINHDRQNSKRLRDVLKNAYGENVEKYVRNLMGDIQGINAKRPNAFNAIINRMRSNYAIFQLGANPKTWFNQLGSMGALYRFCDLDSITKGLIPTNLDKMAEYSTAAAIREGSDVAVKAQTLTSQVSGKVKDVLMKPIGWADMKIVGASWGACQYQVQKDTGYAVGSEENLKAAGQLLNKVINESQDTSLASTKTGIARSDNELIRSLAMFRSAPFKQYSRMTDAIGTLSILSAKKKAGQTVSDERMAAAKKELARTGAGWALQAAIGVAISLLFNWLYDKNKEVTAKDVALDYSSELISVIPLVGDLYNYIVSGYDLSYFAFDMLNDGLSSTQYSLKTVGRALSGDNVSRQDIAKMLDKDATVIGQFTGMPTRNVKNALVGLTKRLSSIFGGSLGYRLDAARYSQSYQSDLQKALEDGNDRLAETIVELLYSDKKATSEASEAVVSEVVRLYGEGYKNVLPPTVSSTVTVDGVEYDMTAKDQKKIRSVANGADRVITGMISTDTYKGLDDADRAKAIGKIYDVYYDRALSEVFGVPMTKADAISRLGDEAVIFSAAAHVANIESDKDANGKTIANSRKNKVNEYLTSLGLDLDTLSLILYASGYSSEALKKQVGTVAATANLDADTYADVYGALNLASA